MNHLLAATGLPAHVCAELLGFNSTLYNEWSAGQRSLPDSHSHLLAAVLGVSQEDLESRKVEQGNIPAVWYKLRGEEVVDADREFVLLVRKLGFLIHQLEEVTFRRLVVWRTLFESIRRETDLQASPQSQGRAAAGVFREASGLSQCATGIGETLRENLRSNGVLVVESSLRGSSISGCAFYVGDRAQPRPCLFANGYRSTWFSRNFVIAHELAHAIFDIFSSGASLDTGATKADALTERRADSFARELLIPIEVLRHLSQGLRIDSPAEDTVAELVSRTHMEPKVLGPALVEAGLMPEGRLEDFLALNISSALRAKSTHALSGIEYIQAIGDEKANRWRNKRDTETSPLSLRLPSHYVDGVVKAFNDGKINAGRAAELLMVGEETFLKRFDIEVGTLYDD